MRISDWSSDVCSSDLVAEVELTYNWPPVDGSAPEEYSGGRNFGHLAYRVDDIYATCQRLMDAGVTINRPPRDGHMAFVRSPDGLSVGLLQEGRSEEHTSELQSLMSISYDVFCLKKKNKRC